MPRAFVVLCAVVAACSAQAGSAAAEPAAPGSLRVLEPWRFGDRPPPPPSGSRGALATEPPPETGHPLPRVVVEVPSAKGALKASSVEAAARRGFWGKAIACYRRGAYKDQALEGDTLLEVTIRAGRVRSAKVRTPMKAPAVSKCLATSFVGLEMPSSKKATSARVRVRLFPGDEPVAPPSDALEPGPGSVDLARAKATVEAAGAPLLACYRDALAWAPELRGLLAVRFRVDASGAVGEAFEEGGPFPEERVTRCILREARKLRFDPPAGGAARVVVPIELSP